jgi:hypothetical protein
MITISAFKWVPDFAQGLVRDLRARWVLEEAGLPYRTRLLEQGDQDKPDYRARQPFGQVSFLRRMASSCSNPAPSCSISASAARRCCRATRLRASARRNG